MKLRLLSAIAAMFVYVGVAACDAGDGPTDPGQDDVLVPDTQPDEFRPTTFEFSITPAELTVYVTITDTTGRVMKDGDGTLLDRVPVLGMATLVAYHPEKAKGYNLYAKIESEYPIQIHATKTWYNKCDSVFTESYNSSTTDMKIVITGPTEDKCESIRASGLCRTWHAFALNGDNVAGEIHVSCETVFEGCSVREQNEDTFFVRDVTFIGTAPATVDTPLTVSEKPRAITYDLAMWIEGDTLHISVKESADWSPDEYYLLLAR